MSREITIGDRQYRLCAAQSRGAWFAHAEIATTGERASADHGAASEAEALDAVARWLEWEHEHAVALKALQQAEHAYHRTLAGSAFVSPVEGPSAIEMQKESLEQVEAARVRLDEVRARRPD